VLVLAVGAVVLEQLQRFLAALETVWPWARSRVRAAPTSYFGVEL